MNTTEMDTDFARAVRAELAAIGTSAAACSDTSAAPARSR